MKVKIVNQSRFALPEYQTPLSAGLDIRADIEQSITLAPLERALVPTGLYVELPEGYEMQIEELTYERALEMTRNSLLGE